MGPGLLNRTQQKMILSLSVVYEAEVKLALNTLGHLEKVSIANYVRTYFILWAYHA